MTLLVRRHCVPWNVTQPTPESYRVYPGVRTVHPETPPPANPGISLSFPRKPGQMARLLLHHRATLIRA